MSISFQPDRPYEKEKVDEIKTKFQQWDKQKIKTVNNVMKDNFNQRKREKIN